MVEGGGLKVLIKKFLKKDQTHDFVLLKKTLWITLKAGFVLELG